MFWKKDSQEMVQKGLAAASQRNPVQQRRPRALSAHQDAYGQRSRGAAVRRQSAEGCYRQVDQYQRRGIHL